MNRLYLGGRGVPPTLDAAHGVRLLALSEHSTRRIRLPLLWLVLIVVGLLSIHAALAISASSTKSLTFDEPTHLTAGTSYWLYNDYRLQPENGVFPQRVEGIPGAVMAPDSFPKPDAYGWSSASVFMIGRQWFKALGPRMQTIIMSARCANLLFGLALGITVFLWSRRLFGDIGGIVSLSLYCFCPTMLAHGPMISSDISAGLFFMLSSAALWAVCHRVSPGRIVLLGLALGGMATSKFSAPLMVAIGGILLLTRWFLGPTRLPVSWWTATAMRLKPASAKIPMFVVPSFIVAGLIALAIVWGMLGFRFAQICDSPLPPLGEHPAPWEELTANPDLASKVISWAREHQLFPEAYLYGQLYVITGAKSRSCFWDGEFSVYGWPMFFPYVFLVKTPLTTLAVLLMSAIGWGRYCLVRGKGRKRDPSLLWVYRVTPLLALIAVYATAAILSHINIGHRHILPIYPALYVLAGAAGWWISRTSRSCFYWPSKPSGSGPIIFPISINPSADHATDTSIWSIARWIGARSCRLCANGLTSADSSMMALGRARSMSKATPA